MVRPAAGRLCCCHLPIFPVLIDSFSLRIPCEHQNVLNTHFIALCALKLYTGIHSAVFRQTSCLLPRSLHLQLHTIVNVTVL